MKRTIKVILVAGARPNFMKIAPLMRCISQRNAIAVNGDPVIEPLLVHTGQHYDDKMSGIFFEELRIPPPDINLDVGSGSHAQQTAQIMMKFETVCLENKPDWVVVVGDVNSTMACTLVCSKLGVKVAHVEAGLRSFDREMPEELNRLVTDALADLLLTPSEDADVNLEKEGVDSSRIKLVGNVMIDTLVDNLERAKPSEQVSALGLEKNGFVFVTLHRPGNVDAEETLRPIIDELARLAGKMPVVFPIHPRTQKMCDTFGISLDEIEGLHLLPPVGYHDSLFLTENARLVLTDSGGLQEESTYFTTPCLTLRPNTERPVTISVGSNKLTDLDRLRADIDDVLSATEGRGKVPPLWDGKAAERIVDALCEC